MSDVAKARRYIQNKDAVSMWQRECDDTNWSVQLNDVNSNWSKLDFTTNRIFEYLKVSNRYLTSDC